MTTQATDSSDNYHRYREVKEKARGGFGGLSTSNVLVMVSVLGLLVVVSSAVTSCWVFMKKTPLHPSSSPTDQPSNSSREWQSLYFSELAEGHRQEPRGGEQEAREFGRAEIEEMDGMQLVEEDGGSGGSPGSDPCNIDETKNRRLMPYNAHSCISNEECTGQRVCTAFGWCRGKSLCGKNQLQKACKIIENTDFACQRDEQCRGARICSDSKLCEGLDQC